MYLSAFKHVCITHESRQRTNFKVSLTKRLFLDSLMGATHLRYNSHTIRNFDPEALPAHTFRENERHYCRNNVYLCSRPLSEETKVRQALNTRNAQLVLEHVQPTSHKHFDEFETSNL